MTPPLIPPDVGPSAWSLVVSVDPSLDVQPDPAMPCPRGVPDMVVRVDRPEILLGRHDERRDIHPDLPLRDPGASRRHAKILLLAGGTLALQDLGSMNGTKVNGVEVEPSSRTPLLAGDEVTFGRWTRIRVMWNDAPVPG